MFLGAYSLNVLNYHFDVCGDCLTADPKQVAEKARAYAPILRRTIPDRGADRDMNIEWAKALLLVAGLFGRIDSIEAIADGVMARHIGEAYRELNAPKRRGKAA